MKWPLIWKFPRLILRNGTETVLLGCWEPTMAETTKEKFRTRATTGSDLRDIAGAWLVCRAQADRISTVLSEHGVLKP